MWPFVSILSCFLYATGTACPYSSILSMAHSFYPCIFFSFIGWFIVSLAHSFCHWLIDWLIDWFTHLLSASLTRKQALGTVFSHPHNLLQGRCHDSWFGCRRSWTENSSTLIKAHLVSWVYAGFRESTKECHPHTSNVDNHNIPQTKGSHATGEGAGLSASILYLLLSRTHGHGSWGSRFWCLIYLSLSFSCLSVKKEYIKVASSTHGWLVIKSESRHVWQAYALVHVSWHLYFCRHSSDIVREEVKCWAGDCSEILSR